MRRKVNASGFTLIEMIIVIAIMATVSAVAGPEILKVIRSDTTVKSAARKLIADMKTAQNEAVRRGGGDMSNGILVRKSVFVVFPAGTNTYQTWDYTDTNGNGSRDADPTDTVTRIVETSLSASVRFGVMPGATSTTCTANAAGAPPASGVSFSTDGSPPCGVNGCLELNGNGFPIGGNPTGGTIYVTNGKYAYAVNINAAGNFTLCKWPGANAWVIAR
jgi:prepilin-type N-terminal cleavage/methylation domain-containing protein